MKSNNLITIIVPVYNTEKYLNKCLDSVVDQSYNKIDILIVNDGSTDNSKNIIDDYKEKDRRIKVINQPNGGYGNVLMKAFNNIDTEYFLICDSDDYLEKTAVECLVEPTLISGADIVYGKFYNVVDNQIIEPYFSYFTPLLDGQEYKDDIDRFVFMPVSPHSKLYKTSIIQGIYLPSYIYFTDALLYYYALSKSKSIVFVDKYLSNYLCQRDGNTQTDDNPVVYDYHHEIVKQIIMQCDIKNHKYLALGLLFYNWYTLCKLSEKNEDIINDKIDKIIDMYSRLIPFSDTIDLIPEISNELITFKNKFLSEYSYIEFIREMISDSKYCYNEFLKKLQLLYR